ncbi:formin-2-like [Pyrus ussuriensis x Pyrus communis]|uniref:Formin-2-like n=1 Tax=Pyrus ussuriensis x Pyrus communis TaxID=2448454 RepID=A0A5N5FTK8_9ROSA|nr:formin-2-like [Pyrus ussuriensis x Pyrus communis]
MVANHVEARQQPAEIPTQVEEEQTKGKPLGGSGNDQGEGKVMEQSSGEAKMDELGEKKNLPPLPNIPILLQLPIPQFPFPPQIPGFPIPQFPFPPQIPGLPIPQFPFPPPFEIPNAPPFPSIPNFPFPPFNIPNIPFFSPPPA